MDSHNTPDGDYLPGPLGTRSGSPAILGASGVGQVIPTFRSQPAQVAAIYLAVSAGWIVLSDRLVAWWASSDPELLARLGEMKGLAFVLVTGTLLYWLLRRASISAEHAFRALQRESDERARHQQALQRAEAIIESTEDAVVGMSPGGVIVEWNRAAERMFGYAAREIIGAPMERLVPQDHLAEEREHRARARQGDFVQTETVRRRKDGELLDVSITVSPMWALDASAGAVLVGLSAILRDVTERKRAQAKAEAEQRFASDLIEAMPGIFYFYDERGRFLRWNANFERVSGCSAREIGEMHPTDFFAGRDRERLRERIEEVFEKGESSVEADFVAKGGKATPYFFTGRRIEWQGQPCLVGVGVDISERTRAEMELRRSEERFRTTLDGILEGCQILDFEWRYLYVNDAAVEQNRRPRDELLGRPMPEVWPGIEATEFYALIERCMVDRAHQHGEVEFVFPEGAKAWFDVRVEPVPEGIFLLSIDVSESRQAELALRELNQSLEAKVSARTQDLEVARARAEDADRTKSAFLATMSHELRTPLNSIIGFSGILTQELAGPLNPEQRKQLGMVQSSARHLLSLINDVLDISKIEAGEVEIRPAPFDLGPSVRRLVESVRPLAEQKGLTMRIMAPDAPVEMVSDQRRVEQVLLNLLSNAVKFTQEGGVTVELLQTEGGAGVELRVIDTGIGIDRAGIAQLFQPFRQLDSSLHRQREGTGLGLAICRRLTHMLGGRIDVRSTLGRGSQFTVELPSTFMEPESR